LHMPDMDGLAVVRALRELSADARVLIFTADLRPSAEAEALAAGACALLPKPASRASLAEALARHAPRVSGAGQASARAPLVALFARTYPVEVSQLRQAVAAGDARAYGELLHGLRGASALLGFAEVAALCEAGEEGLTLGQVARLEDECGKAVAGRAHALDSALTFPRARTP